MGAVHIGHRPPRGDFEFGKNGNRSGGFRRKVDTRTRMQQRFYSRIEFARLAGVTKQAIGKARRGKLKPACQGSRIDAAHPAAREYLASHGVIEGDGLSGASAGAGPATPKPAARAPRAPTGSAKPTGKASSAPAAPNPPAPAKDVVRLVSREVRDLSEVADMTIRQVVAKFGTVTAFKDWLASLKTIEDVREKNLRNAETDGNLISIRLVTTHVMGAIESGNRRLLTDSPKTIARRCYAAANGGRPIEEAEQMVREIISSQLKPMKDAAARTLRGPQAPA